MDWQASIEGDRRGKDEAFRDDPHSPLPTQDRIGFKGLQYFAPDPRYALEADLVREEQTTLEIQRSGGDVVVYTRLGHFALTLPEGECRLALYESDGHPFLPFRDATSGKETYGAGRYLDPPEVAPGRFALDFNQAYNPYCAYNEAYSCPFPPPENWLQIPIRAGEKTYAST